MTDKFGYVTRERTISMTDSEVRAWLEAHTTLGDITDDFRRNWTDAMDEFA